MRAYIQRHLWSLVLTILIGLICICAAKAQSLSIDDETQAQPIGGHDKFIEAIGSKIKYPEGLTEKGRSFVEFVVDSLGQMKDVKLVRGFNKLADEEALRVLSSLNYPFTPGTRSGVPITTRLVIPVSFYPATNCQDKTSTSIIHSTQLKGTLIIGAIGTDGIIIAVDSRASIIRSNGRIMGYIDSVPKMNLLSDQYPIAFAGNSTLREDFIYNIIGNFNKIASKDKNVQESFIDFREYLSKIDNDFSQQFVGGGYYNGAPYLFSFNKSDKSADGNGFVFSEPDLAPYLENYTDTIKSCDELRGIMESVIYKYAKEKNKEYEIGGPISIIKVADGNKITWIQNNLSHNNVKDYTTLVEFIKTDKIKLTPTQGNDKGDVITAMMSNQE